MWFTDYETIKKGHTKKSFIRGCIFFGTFFVIILLSSKLLNVGQEIDRYTGTVIALAETRKGSYSDFVYVQLGGKPKILKVSCAQCRVGYVVEVVTEKMYITGQKKHFSNGLPVSTVTSS